MDLYREIVAKVKESCGAEINGLSKCDGITDFHKFAIANLIVNVINATVRETIAVTKGYVSDFQGNTMRKANWINSKEVPFNTLAGLVLIRAERFGDEQIEFETQDGRVFVMHHHQECCEKVEIESIVGDLQNLVGEPILLAEEVSGETAQPDGWTPPEFEESLTWTFYKLATRKGYVDIRWLGSSNGYYGERVDFVEMKGCEA